MLQALLCTWHHLALQLSRNVGQGWKSWVLQWCLIPSKCKEAQRPTATAPSGLCVPLGNLAATTVKPRAKLYCPPSAIPRQSLVYFGFILSAAVVQWDQASHVPPPGTAAYAASSKNKEQKKQAKNKKNKPFQQFEMQFEIHTLCWAESIAKASVLNLGSLETVLRSLMQDLKIAIILSWKQQLTQDGFPNTKKRSVLGGRSCLFLLPLSWHSSVLSVFSSFFHICVG